DARSPPISAQPPRNNRPGAGAAADPGLSRHQARASVGRAGHHPPAGRPTDRRTGRKGPPDLLSGPGPGPEPSARGRGRDPLRPDPTAETPSPHEDTTRLRPTEKRLGGKILRKAARKSAHPAH